MDWFPVSVEKVVREQFLEQYKRTLAVYYSEIVRFNINVFILDQLSEFPFQLFGDGDGDIFFYSYVLNAFETAALTVHKLLKDTEPEAYTFSKFKNDIAKNILDEYRAEYHRQLKKAKVSATVRDLLEKARIIRNNQIAHLSRSVAVDRSIFGGLSLSELHSIRDNLNTIYSTLCFNTESMFLPVPYSPSVQHPVGTDTRPDIVRILDLIAKESHLLNMPERSPQMWAMHKQRSSKEHIELINKYRKRNGLAEA